MDYMAFNNDGDMVGEFHKEDVLIIELYAKLGYNILDLDTGKLIDFEDIKSKLNYCG